MAGTARSGGSNRKTAAQHVLQGTFRPDRHAQSPNPPVKRPGSPQTPKGLSAAARGWWRRLLREYAIDDEAGLLLLESALRQFDRAEEARAILAKDGLVLVDRFGQQKAHPAASLERDARAGLLAALRALSLDPGDAS